MNPCRLFHVVQVERGRDVISAQGELIPGQMDLVRAALRCEVAALAARQLLADLSQHSARSAAAHRCPR